MKILLVLCHPRRNSFSGALADAFSEEAAKAGHEVEFADLYGEKFDPVLHEADEPDWDNPGKEYSEEVRAEMARLARNQAVVMVCPIWWWSVPAMLKGWVDRVWNLGFAYGDASLPHSHSLLIGVAAASAEAFAKRGYDSAIDVQVATGIMNYCGIANGRVELLHDATGDASTRACHLERVRRLGACFPEAP